MTRNSVALHHWRALPPMPITLLEAVKLLEYSASNPSGVTVGKMWRRHNGAHDAVFIHQGGTPRWVICRYEEAPDSYTMTNWLMTSRGEPKPIVDCTAEENGASKRIYTRTQMCKTVTYRAVIRVKMGRNVI